MKTFILILIMGLALPGCALFNKTTTCTMPNGDVYVLNQPSDAHTIITLPDGTIVNGNNQGKLGPVESALQILLMNLPDITIGND